MGFSGCSNPVKGGGFGAGRGLTMPTCFVSFCLMVNDFTSRSPTAITAPLRW